jgi:hypothetical protein
LRPRPQVLNDFEGALFKRALRIRRRQVLAAQVPETEVQQRRRLLEQEELVQPHNDVVDVAALFDVARTPFDQRRVFERARRLYDEGLHLLPLEPRSKEPATRWSEWQGRQMPISLLRRHLEELGEDAGLAIICGAGSGVIVADLDDATAVAWARVNLPETPWRTGTARGEHWFYRYPTEPLPSKAPPWTGQLQSDGRYVVAPGSLHPAGHRYACIGDWSQPLSALPIFRSKWLVDVDAQRAARQNILKRS